ncbi:4a-hydroxytetrahydrobiopterin dehydratase [Propionicicella superfundia]|uniref:4a-hydroxytetrahydrobiopterin dehydratase n=1 Tax=Propionicicella superfundia TaxID=348582 RepID=UPI0004298790|nr:4a-hydroxytetrahydrobiopterin dehydratase [Propionicicella superfundia]
MSDTSQTSPQLGIGDILAADLTDWRLLAQDLHARFRTGAFATGLDFVTAVGGAAETAGHHPGIRLEYGWVDLTLRTHEVGGVTRRDVDLALRISAIARAMGLPSEPGALAEVELALDTAMVPEQGPFWASLLTGSTANAAGDDVVDPARRVPLLWFQHTDSDRPDRQRFHLDVWVPHDVAQRRIDAALAAGGTLVTDEYAPSFVVLADPEGNRVCVCTCLER